MTPDGIVGKVRETFPHTAQVLMIDDPTSGAGVFAGLHQNPGYPARQSGRADCDYKSDSGLAH